MQGVIFLNTEANMIVGTAQLQKNVLGFQDIHLKNLQPERKGILKKYQGLRFDLIK